MQTEWHKTGQAQQGETDLDTSSFTGLQRDHKDRTGKDFTPPQAGAGANHRQKGQESRGRIRSRPPDKLLNHLKDQSVSRASPEPKGAGRRQQDRA